MAIVIRPARLGDCDALAEVHTLGWQRGLLGVVSADYLRSLDVATSAAMWKSRLADPDPATRTLVADIDGDVVGLAGYGRSYDPDLPFTGTVHIGELWLLYVHPDRWRSGIGRLLHDAALVALAAEEFTLARLWVVAGNERAIAFYRRQGWKLEHLTRVMTGGEASWTEHRYRRPLV